MTNMLLAAALPSSLGDWAQVVLTLFGIVMLLGGALAVLRSKQWESERAVLKGSIETLQQAREIDREESQAQQARHDREMADLRAQLQVLHSDFLAGLAESIVTAVVDTLHPLLPSTPPRRRAAPKKGTG